MEQTAEPHESELAPAMEEADCLCGQGETSSKIIRARDELTNGVFEFRRCANCGLERLSPRPTRDSIGSFYADTYYAYNTLPTDQRDLAEDIKRFLYFIYYANDRNVPPRLARFRPVLKTLFFALRHRPPLAFPQPDVCRLFEFGAATGRDLARYRSLGWEVTGCEPSAKAVETARLRGIELQNAGAEDARLTGQYSCIIMNNVFEHIHDVDLVLNKCHAALTPGGYLVLILPNHDAFTAKVFGAAWPGYEVPRHIWGFSPGPVRSVLNKAGFRSIRIHQHAPTLWNWRGSLAGYTRPGGPTPLRLTLAKYLAPLLLPLGVIAATLGHGDYMKVIARKDA